MQKLVGRNGYKIRLYPAVHFRCVCLFRPHQITVQWPQNGAERDRHRIQAVCAGGQPIGRLKRMGKRLAGGIAIFQRNVQNPVSTAAQIPEGKGQPAAAQVFPQPHAGIFWIHSSPSIPASRPGGLTLTPRRLRAGYRRRFRQSCVGYSCATDTWLSPPCPSFVPIVSYPCEARLI